MLNMNYFFLLAGKAWNLHCYKGNKKRLEMASITVGANTRSYGINYLVPSTVGAA
jgi:hypothetical protein